MRPTMRRMIACASVCLVAASLAGCPSDPATSTPNQDIPTTNADASDGAGTPDAEPDAIPDAEPDTTGDGGAEVISCTNECTEEDALSCNGATVTRCGDGDDDGCLEWLDLLTCGAGTTCDAGTCVAACPDQACTTVGARKCEGNSVVTCDDYDADGCLEWGAADDCADLTCSNGFCAISCTDACTVVGAKQCEGNFAVECGDFDTNGCLEWGNPTDCDTNVCSNGFCAASCTNECTVAGSTECDPGGVKTCGDYNTDGCLEWGTPVACDNGQVCSNGACAETCSDECTAAGAKQCDVAGNVETCNDYNNDSCLEWGTPVACNSGQVCAGGECTDTCQSECTVIGAKQCDVGGNVVTCGDYNTDGCLEWGTPVGCADGLVCSGGNCAATCTDECSFVNEKECVAGSQVQYQVCGDYDSDSCLEWGTAQNCGAGLVCSGGNCASTCSDSCPSDGDTQCSGNAVELCGDYNADTCVEWGTPAPCAAYEECVAGACEELSPPATVLVAEFMVDTTGSPDTDAFVELYAPPGTDLAGYSLVGVNGNGGGEYATLELNGVVGSDGLWVIAHTGASTAIADMADALDDTVDFQNGPDSIQVKFGSTVVDAVGYGSFGVDDVFAGEGTAVAKPAANASLARDDSYTDTNDNAADFTEVAVPTPGTASTPPNAAPVAALSCPSSAVVGVNVALDATASSDADGSIADYAFDFGDSSPGVNGTSASVTHAFAAAGDYTVTVTVTDDGGATDSANCAITVSAGDGPAVVFIKPVLGATATQGETFQVLVDATAGNGKSVTSVELQVDGVTFGTPDTSAPYEWTYTVPANAATGSTLEFQALATDDAAAIGASEIRTVQVTNDAPTASFTAVVSGALEVTVDANSSSDTETDAANLEVRFDWEDDGTWDTAWGTTKVASHTYAAEGTYTVRMQVRDESGQLDEATRSVSLSLIQTVSGTVSTTTWVGTVVITGDVVVPSGQTLTIDAGTSVLFTPIDQDNDGVGDYDIEIDGSLVVNGTEAEPVLFSVYGANKDLKSWNRVHIDNNNDGSTINWAIFEYGNDCLELSGTVTINDTVTRFCDRGVYVRSGASPADVTRLTSRDNTLQGVFRENGTLNLLDSTIEANGDSGVFIEGGAGTLTGNTLQTNGAAGLEIVGGGSGLMTQNLITANAFEGVRIASDTGNTSIDVRYNNIYGNATVGARVFANISLSVSSSSSSSSDPTSGAYATPNGETVDLVRVTYTDGTSQTGYIRNDAGSVNLRTVPSTSSAWYDIESGGASAIELHIDDASYSGSASMSAHQVAYTELGAVAEVTVATDSEIDLRHNYYGVFPNVLTMVDLAEPADANIHGFIGVPFTDSWSKGPYYGGELLPDTTWSGTIYVTGDVEVGTGATLEVAAGTTIEFAAIDQDLNGVGDYNITVRGTLAATGTSGSPVTFTSQKASPAPGDYQGIDTVSNGSVNLTHTVIEYAQIGFSKAGSGNQSWSNVTVRESADDNLRLTGGGTTALDYLTATQAGDTGLWINGSGVTITNSTITYNSGFGVHVDSGSPTVDHSNIQYNGVGVYFDGTGGTLTWSNVKFNDHEGVLIRDTSSPTITNNNLFGNAVLTGPILADINLSVASSSSSSSDPIGSPFTTPMSEDILLVQYTYTDGTSQTGYIRDGGSTDMVTIPSTSNGFADIMSYASDTVRPRIDDASYSGSASLSLPRAVYRVANTPIEVAIFLNSGTVDCTDNYFGVFPDVESRVLMSQTQALDFQGFQIVEITGTGPQ